MPNSVVVKFTKHGSPLTAKDSRADDAVNATFGSNHAGRFVKKLLDSSDKFKAINSKLNEAYNWHKSVTMPYLDNGMRELNCEYLEKYIEKIGTFKVETQGLLLDLKPVWDEEVTKDIEKMAGLGNASDYPQWKEVEFKYSIDVKILPKPQVEDFRCAVDQSIIDELAHMKEQAKIEGRKEIFGKVEKLCNVAIEQCAKDKGKIYDSMLGNMVDQADLIGILNIHNDVELEGMCTSLRTVAESTNTFNLRNDVMVRTALANRCRDFLGRLNSGGFAVEQETTVTPVAETTLVDSLV